MVPGNWHKLSPMYQPAVPFQENRPICLVSSDAHRRTYIHTQTHSHICIDPLGGAGWPIYSHPSLLIVPRSTYSLPYNHVKPLSLRLIEKN